MKSIPSLSLDFLVALMHSFIDAISPLSLLLKSLLSPRVVTNLFLFQISDPEGAVPLRSCLCLLNSNANLNANTLSGTKKTFKTNIH